MSALGTTFLIIALVVAAVFAILAVMAFVEAYQAERRRQRIQMQRSVSEARIQRMTDQAATQMLAVAKEELMRQAREQSWPASGSTYRADASWGGSCDG